MPKKLKTLERNEGKAPLLVPHPEEEDENFRQLLSDSCRADSGAAFRLSILADRIICEDESGCPYPGEHLHHREKRHVTNRQ